MSLLLCVLVVLQLCLLILIVWAPGFQTFFGTAGPPAIALCPCLFFGAIMLAVSEALKYARRKDPKAFWYMSY